MTSAPSRRSCPPEDQAPTSTPWGPPVPLTAHRLLPPFPVGSLPPWVGDQVDALAEFTQTPPDLAGCLALAVLSAAAGGRAAVQVRGGWHEPVNLFTVVVLPPGSRKSSAFAAMTAPLLAAERRLAEETRPRIVAAEVARKVASRSAERSAAAAATSRAHARVEAVDAATAEALDAESITVPVLPRLIADDITPEAAASLLAEQGVRLAVLSAEGGIFATLAGRYSGGTPNLEVFLKGHAGDMLRVDRKGRPSEHVDAPALTLGLAIQPEVLAALDAMPGFRGRGLLARLLFSLPKNTVGRRRIGTDPVPDEVAKRYARTLAELTCTLAGLIEPAVLFLSPDADRRILALEAAIEPRLGQDGDLGHITDWASKLVGAVARIAGLLHLAAGGTAERPVAGVTVEHAAQLGRYFLGHALAAFDQMGADPVVEEAKALLRWIERTGADRFTRRDLFTGVRSSRFRTVADIDAGLNLLEGHDYIRLEPTAEVGARGGRPASPTYGVNPFVLSAEPAQPAEPRRG